MSAAKYKTSSTNLHGDFHDRWVAFWNSLHDAEKYYLLHFQQTEVEADALRIYHNTDGTWSLMPNWFKTAEQNHKRGATTTYTDFNKIPEHIQEKLGVLLLHEPGGDWLAGVGKRIDTGVFWLEDE